jgi:TnpA family transposase
VPTGFLNDAERERLSGFPEEITSEDLFSYFTLTGSDRASVPTSSAPANRLGFAFALCAVRYLGFCPEDLSRTPENVRWYVAEQVGVPAEVLTDYPEREQTRTDHLRRIYEHLGYRRATERDLRELSGWLVERALEHDEPTLLVRLAAERLRNEKVVRPGLSRLQRMVAEARERASMETYRAISPLLVEDRVGRLDGLLVPESTGAPTTLSWLKQGATSNSPKAILAQLKKLHYLRAVGVEHWNLSAVNPNRLKTLARLGRRYTAQPLQRQAPARRHPILLAFLKESHTEITDEIVDLFERCLAQADARARRELEEFRKKAARATNEAVVLLGRLIDVIGDPGVADDEVPAALYERVASREELLAVREESGRLARPLDDNYFDFLAERYYYIRQFAPAFLDAFEFRSNQRSDPLLEAILVLRGLNREGRRRRVPEGAPLSFVPPKWGPYVVREDGGIEKRYWELCLLVVLREALRSGDIWVEGSRRYADPQSFLIPKDRWPSVRPEFCALSGTPADGAAHLEECRAALTSLVENIEMGASRGRRVMWQSDRLVFSREPSEEVPRSVIALGAEIDRRLPRVELTNLLVEVDRLTNFTGRLTHAAGSEPRTPDLKVHLYASILAQATNLGPVKMAELSDLSYRRLAWAANWYLREETLKSANGAIVDFHYGLPLSRRWGGGTLSSSDGQRFPVDVKAKNATANPRYYGYGKGVTFYSWTSDQFSQYGTKVIPTTVRDATYVLDEILGNETELPIAEHAVDTHGFTEVIFSLFSALGLRFSPRIRDVSDQRLYLMDGVSAPKTDPSLFKGKINERLILRHWDDILRVAGSLKLGWVTASLLVSRLQAKPRKNALTRALQEYGRLQKTLFLLRYAQDIDLRKRIGRQLNKGEELHALRRFIFFANEGHVRKRQPVEQAEQALCLNLVTSSVITWNALRYQEILAALKEEGYPLRVRDLAHLSPARHGHVNPYGRYHFDTEARPGTEEPGPELLV